MTDRGIHRNDRAVFRPLESGAGGVLLHLDSGEYRQLNETGSLIWTLLEAAPSRAELIEGIRRTVTDPPEDLDAQVDAFLASLRERGLIELEEEGR